MGQDTIHVRGKANGNTRNGYDELPATLLDVPDLPRLSNPHLNTEVKTFIDSLVVDKPEDQKLIVLLDEYSFLPPNFLLPLITAMKDDERIHKIILTGLSQDIDHRNIPGYAVIHAQKEATFIRSCGAFIPGVDDLAESPEEWTPTSNCTNRFIPIKTQNGVEVYIRDLHAPVVMPQQMYKVVYAPGTLDYHHFTFLEQSGLLQILEQIRNPKDPDEKERISKLKALLLREA